MLLWSLITSSSLQDYSLVKLNHCGVHCSNCPESARHLRLEILAKQVNKQ